MLCAVEVLCFELSGIRMVFVVVSELVDMFNESCHSCMPCAINFTPQLFAIRLTLQPRPSIYVKG